MLLVVSWLSLFAPHAHATGHAYTSWTDYGWHRQESERVEIERAGIAIEVIFYTDWVDGPSSRYDFEAIAEATYDHLSSRISLGPCYDWQLVVYDVSQEVINSRSVLYWFPWTDPYQRLYGAYDSLHTDASDTAAILVRNDLPEDERRRTLAHELTHYWYDMCVSDGMGEAHAEAAEDLFR